MRTRPAIIATALVPFLLSPAVVGLGTGPAGAAGATGQGPPNHLAAKSAAARHTAMSYWTPQRMRDARPLDLVTAHGSHAKLPAIAAARTQGEPWTDGGAVAKTLGRVFFTTNGGATASCSGDVVNSANHSVVVTAGHCVRNGGAWNGAWVFVPGYHDGKRPYGTWVANMLATTPQWQKSENTDYDVGMAVIAPLDGKRVADTVGGQAIGFGQSRGRQVAAFGYPAEGKYDGTKQIICSGTVSADTTGASKDQALGCDQTGGASGGPWLTGFETQDGTGTQYSVNSFKYEDQPNYMYGPYFGDVVKDLYTWTAAQ